MGTGCFCVQQLSCLETWRQLTLMHARVCTHTHSLKLTKCYINLTSKLILHSYPCPQLPGCHAAIPFESSNTSYFWPSCHSSEPIRSMLGNQPQVTGSRDAYAPGAPAREACPAAVSRFTESPPKTPRLPGRCSLREPNVSLSSQRELSDITDQ